MYYRFFIIPVFIFLLIGCSNNEKDTPTNKKNKKQQQAQTKKISKSDNTVLTNKNVIGFLKEYGEKNQENKVIMKTTLGDIHISLYKDTPLHRANFIRLVKKKFYNNTLFYRVIKGFVVQGGGSDELSHGRKKRKIGKYTLPAEFKNQHFHKKGALAAARNYEKNPDKRSTPYDFYFVHGALYDKVSLDALALENDVTFSEAQKKVYYTLGGSPHLDNEHTVFGEVTKGLDIVDAIAAREVGEGDWPLENVYIESIAIVE